MANEEKMTENAVSKAMKPSLATLNRIESGIVKLGTAAAGGAEARVEEARAKKKSDDREEKANTLLGDMVKGITDLKKTLMESMKTKVKGGFGALLAGITAPIIMLASFFKQLKAEFAMLKTLTGGGLKKLFAPLKNLLKGEGTLGKALKGALKFMDKMSGGIFTKIGNFFKGIGDFFKSFKKVKPFGPTKPGVLTKGIGLIKDIFKAIGSVFSKIGSMGKTLATFGSKASKIVGWASGFGRILGKLFLPITILMSAFDFVTGFMDGYDQGGILGGLEGGISKLLKGLVVGWALGLMGFDKAKESLADFSFSDLIDDIVGGFFDMVDGVVGWLGDTFKFGSISQALTSMLKPIWMPAILFREWLIDPVVDWLGKKFKFDTTRFKKFSVFDHIETMLSDIGKFFKGLFDIDFKSVLKPMILAVPGGDLLWAASTGLGSLFGGDNKPDDGAAAAAEAKKKKEAAAKKKKEAEELAAAEAKRKKEAAEAAKKIKDRDATTDGSMLGRFVGDVKSSFGFGDKPATSKPTPTKKGSAVSKAVATVPQSAGIDWGFISKKEGGSKIDGYVPNPEGSKSGVTIATGFDLGARNANDLKKLGLPVSLKEKLSPYLGMQGMVAKQYLDQYPLVITPAEAKYIDKASKNDALVRLKKEWNANAKIMKTPMFESLTGAQKTVAASVAFQYGSLKKAPKFRAAAQEGRWDDVEHELKNFGDDYSSRRMSEAKYLMAARQNNSGGVLNNLHASNANARQGGGGSGGSINVNKTNNNSSSSTVVAEAPRARKNLPLGQG